MHKGYLILNLVCHLPFIKHFNDNYPEENYLNLAISNTYLPLLRTLHKLDSDHVPFKLNLTISPTLISMLADPFLQEKYIKYAENRIKFGENEVRKNSSNAEILALARMYLKNDIDNLRDFTEIYKNNILNGFQTLRKNGHLNIITTFATHCYMPFYTEYEKNLEAQIFAAMNVHSEAFNCNPSGFWLPELGYYPGIEKLLKKYKLNYFFTAIHAFMFGNHVPKNGIYAPVNVSDSGVYAFCRDLASSGYVLSSDKGYPGDYDYRDFSSDAAFTDMDEQNPFLHKNGMLISSGYKYFSNNNLNGIQNIYNTEIAAEKIHCHAENYIYILKKRIKSILKYTDRPPVIVCPYDAQVFGHWWYEGIEWLDALIRLISSDDDLALAFPDEYLCKYKNNEVIDLSYSSLGNGGYSGVWLNGDNDWTYKHIHVILEKMHELAKRFPDESCLRERALNHAAREALLVQASDWSFMMKSNISASYAKMRVQEHVYNFLKIYNDLSSGNVDTEWLTKTEKKYSLFKNIDYRIFK